MKKWMKTAAAVFIGAALCTAGATITANAAANLMADGTLILSGNVQRDELLPYQNNPSVKKVICDPGTVFPEDSNHLFNAVTAESIDLTNADTSGVTNMAAMFAYCINLKYLNLNGFDTGSATTMHEMFWVCSHLTSLDLSGFNTENVTDMMRMFAECRALTEINVSSFDTSKVQYMDNAFTYCDNLTTLDLSSFDTNQVTSASDMFFDCKKLKTIYVSEKWDVTNIIEGGNRMFYSCDSLTGGNGTQYVQDYEHDRSGKEYAQIDGKNGSPGYLSYKGNYVKGASLTLDGTIGVNFYANLNEQVAKAVLQGPAGKKEFTDLANAKQEDGSYKFSYGVNAVQADCEVSLKIFKADGTQLDLYNTRIELESDKAVKYSVNEYIAYVKYHAHGEISEKEQRLVLALENFCNTTAEYFHVSSHPGFYEASVTAASLQDADANFAESNLKDSTLSLVLNSATALRIYYPHTMEIETVTYQAEGVPVTDAILGQNDFGKYIEIPNIPAQNLTRSYTVTVNGVSSTVSPLNYVKRFLEQTEPLGQLYDSEEKLDRIVRALYVYAQAAKAYYADAAN